MVVRDGKSKHKEGSFAIETSSNSRQQLTEDKEACKVVERRKRLCQDAVEYLQKIVSNVANKYEKHSGVIIYQKTIEEDLRLQHCLNCLLTVSHHCRSYAIELIIKWMKEFHSKYKNSKNFLGELLSTDTGGLVVYLCQLRTIQLLLDQMLLEKCEIPRNMVDDLLSLTAEKLTNMTKNFDNDCPVSMDSVLTACSGFLGSLSMFSLHEILVKFHGKILSSIGNTTLSTLFSLRDSENENLLYLKLLKGLRISLSSSHSIKMAAELLEFYRSLLTGSRSTAIKHTIADNICTLLSRNLHMEYVESVSMAKWYKLVDELYNLFQKWLKKPKYMTRGFLACAMLLKTKHLDTLKRELWPFVMSCCKQYEDAKDLQLKIATSEALSHALTLYMRTKDPCSISTEQLQQVLKKILSPDRLFCQTNKDLYTSLAKCLIIIVHFSPHIWIGTFEEWLQSNKVVSISEVSYVFCNVLVLSLNENSLLRDEESSIEDSFEEGLRSIEWSPEDKSKLAQISCLLLKTTHAYLDRMRSQTLYMQDPLDIHRLLEVQLKGVQCLLDAVDQNEIQSLYTAVTDLACQNECTFVREAELLLLDMCRQKRNAEEFIVFQISSKFNFRKSNPLDVSYINVGRVIEVLTDVLQLRKCSTPSILLDRPMGEDLKTTLLRIQETFILLYFLPSIELRKKLRESLKLIQDLIFERKCSELEEFSTEDKLYVRTEELKPRSSSKGTDDEISSEQSSAARFSHFLCRWRTFLSFTVKHSLENSKAGILNAEQMLSFLKGHFEQSLQSNARLHDRFPGFHIVNITYLESIELNFSLLFYILCSVNEQRRLTSTRLTGDNLSQVRKIFQLVLSPNLLGIDGTKSSFCTVYFSRLLEVIRHGPSQLCLYIALEAEELAFTSPAVHPTKGRTKRQKDQYRICYAKILVALLDSLKDKDWSNNDNKLLELYARFFSKMVQIMTQTVENPQNPFDLMALRETFCLCLLKALNLFIFTANFADYFKGIWKATLLLMQRWISSSDARKNSSASRGSSIFRNTFDRNSREEAPTVEDFQERIRRLSLTCVTVLLGYEEYFGISKDSFYSVSFRLDSLFHTLMEEFKFFDSYSGEKPSCEYSMLKPAVLNMLRKDRYSLQALMKLTMMSSPHSNETVTYHATLLLLEYIRIYYDREDVNMGDEQLCIELLSQVYLIMGWDRERLYPLALEALISLINTVTKNFTYEFSLEFHEYFPTLCQDETLIKDISKRGAILCAKIASDVVNAIVSKVRQSIKDNTGYNHSRILSLLGPWLERGDISELAIQELLSLEETIWETSFKVNWKTFDDLWHALGCNRANSRRAIRVFITATGQKLKQSNKRNIEMLELIKRAAVSLSENNLGFFLLDIFSYVVPNHRMMEASDSVEEVVSERKPNRAFEDIPIVAVLLSETIQRNNEVVREFLPNIFHLAIFTQTLNNILYQRHGKMLLANVLSRFVLPYIERSCRQDTWRHCVQLSAEIASGIQQTEILSSPSNITCPPEEMLSPANGDLRISNLLKKLIEMCSYCEPQLGNLWSRYCLTLIQYQNDHSLGVVTLRLYRLLGPCSDKDSVDSLLSCAKTEFFTNNPYSYRVAHLLQIFYTMATRVEKENLVTVPRMLAFAFELSCSKELWLRLHGAYLFTKLYCTGNSVGEGIFHQLLETEFSGRLENSPSVLEICKLAIATTQLQQCEHVIFIYLTLLLRIPWQQVGTKKKISLVPVIVSTFIFLTVLLSSQDDYQTMDEQLLQLYRHTVFDTDWPAIPVENQCNSVGYFRITCVHLCYILKRLHLSNLAQTLQSFCTSRKYWKVEDFLYQLRSPLLSFWLTNANVCQDVVIAWLETNNSPSYRRGVLRLLETVVVQAGQQSSLSLLIHHSSDILKVLISSVDGGCHEEVLHLLELLVIR